MTAPIDKLTAVKRYIVDPMVVAVARHVAIVYSRSWGSGIVEVDVAHLVRGELSKTLVWGDVLRQGDAEAMRVTAALLALGLVVKTGRGRAARFVLNRVELPDPVLTADALRVEFAPIRRTEAQFSELAHRSPAMALLGLERDRALEALRRMCADERCLMRLDYLMGSERVLVQSPWPTLASNALDAVVHGTNDPVERQKRAHELLIAGTTLGKVAYQEFQLALDSVKRSEDTARRALNAAQDAKSHLARCCTAGYSMGEAMADASAVMGDAS